MRIIPAIDLIDGKCVRLTRGDYDTKKVYNEDPLEVARAFEDAGLQYLHLVDLDGARAGRIVNWRVLERLASRTALRIDFGGGVKQDDDLRIAFECGAAQVTGGTVAVRHPDRFEGWLMRYGADRIILGCDLRDGRVAVSGWEEDSALDWEPFLRAWQARGARYVVSTDIGRDGMLQGPATELYRQMREACPELRLIASGGIRALDDLDALAEAGCEGAIVGKAIYEGRLSPKALARWSESQPAS